MLFRSYSTSGVAQGEASVNAETASTTKFVTFAQTSTGVAYANPSTTQSASITFAVFNTAGTPLGTKTITPIVADWRYSSIKPVHRSTLLALPQAASRSPPPPAAAAAAVSPPPELRGESRLLRVAPG